MAEQAPSITLKEFDRKFCTPTPGNLRRAAHALREFYLSHPFRQPRGEKPITKAQLEQQAQTRTAKQIAFLYPGVAAQKQKAA
jgi:hypothetical protein